MSDTSNYPLNTPPAPPPAPTPTSVAADPVTVVPSPAPAPAPDSVVVKPAEAAWYVKALVFFGVLAAVLGVHYAYQHGMVKLPAIPSLSSPAAPPTP